ncbi:MAG: hypothetical protein M3Q27_10025 [Actinomycetota bacterium]|nr:hypothetical protein [Actinomycetota bacterium]
MTRSVWRTATRPGSLVSLATQLLVARTAWQRLHEVREGGGRLEALDAGLNLAAILTGTAISLRHLRRGQEA